MTQTHMLLMLSSIAQIGSCAFTMEAVGKRRTEAGGAQEERDQDAGVEVEGGSVRGKRLPQVHHQPQALAQRLEEQLRMATGGEHDWV